MHIYLDEVIWLAPSWCERAILHYLHHILMVEFNWKYFIVHLVPSGCNKLCRTGMRCCHAFMHTYSVTGLNDNIVQKTLVGAAIWCLFSSMHHSKLKCIFGRLQFQLVISTGFPNWVSSIKLIAVVKYSRISWPFRDHHQKQIVLYMQIQQVVLCWKTTVWKASNCWKSLVAEAERGWYRQYVFFVKRGRASCEFV